MAPKIRPPVLIDMFSGVLEIYSPRLRFGDIDSGDKASMASEKYVASDKASRAPEI